MKKTAVIIGVALSISSAWATLVTDDFNRTAAMNSTGQTIGTDWHSSRTTGQWGITNQQVVANMTEADSVLYNSSLETISGGGTNFTASLDVKALVNNAWAGLVFNYQNPTNFYYFRYKSGASNYAIARVVDGVAGNLVNLTITGTFATNTDYSVSVASSNAYEFAYEIKETVGGSVLVSGTATDSVSSFTGGYAGILQTTTGAGRHTFDNFSLEVIPEPATIGMLSFGLVAILVSRRLRP
jgi:hypothetical protein